MSSECRRRAGGDGRYHPPYSPCCDRCGRAIATSPDPLLPLLSLRLMESKFKWPWLPPLPSLPDSRDPKLLILPLFPRLPDLRDLPTGPWLLSLSSLSLSTLLTEPDLTNDSWSSFVLLLLESVDFSSWHEVPPSIDTLAAI